MNQPNDNAPVSSPAPATWPRPTLTTLPPLRDLTLQSAAISAAGSDVAGLSFLP